VSGVRIPPSPFSILKVNYHTQNLLFEYVSFLTYLSRRFCFGKQLQSAQHGFAALAGNVREFKRTPGLTVIPFVEDE
jgi:hypothetical protein